LLLLTPFKDTIGVIRIRISKRNWTTQWPKKGEKDKQRSTKHTHKTQDRVTRTPLIIWREPGAPKWLTVPAPLVVCLNQYVVMFRHYLVLRRYDC
jgi:hypothetical protein